MDLISKGPGRKTPHILLAHGAGAPMDSPFMSMVCEQLAANGITSLRFEFSYMAARRKDGKRRPPPRAPRLEEEFLDAIAAARSRAKTVPFFIGGKSMGGRIASLLAENLYQTNQISGLVCLGYPFHPPGKPDRLRTDHLKAMTCPTLILQGERDPFGGRGEVEHYGLPESISVEWAPDGNHDLAPRVKSGLSGADNLAHATKAIATFMEKHG